MSNDRLNERPKMDERPIAKTVQELTDYGYYRIGDLKSILQHLGLNYSIYTIRDCETYKCLNYSCHKRHDESVTKCERCGGEVRKPLIDSPRTPGGGKGVGHRRYTGAEIKKIVEIFKQRR